MWVVVLQQTTIMSYNRGVVVSSGCQAWVKMQNGNAACISARGTHTWIGGGVPLEAQNIPIGLSSNFFKRRYSFSSEFYENRNPFLGILPRGGGLTLETGKAMCRGIYPFFQASLAYHLVPQCASRATPPFQFFRKHFQPCFGSNFSYQDANFLKTPHF